MSEQQTVAVLGASSDRSKYGNKCVRAYLDEGWRVVPVNPSGGTIEGLPVEKRLADISGDLDRIAVYLPPPVTYDLLDEIAAAGGSKVYFNPGTADDRVLKRAAELAIPAVPACAIVAIGRSPSEFS